MKQGDSAYSDTRYHSVVCPFDCLSEGPRLCRRGRAAVPRGKGRFGGQNPQFAAIPRITKLLRLLSSSALFFITPRPHRGIDIGQLWRK